MNSRIRVIVPVLWVCLLALGVSTSAQTTPQPWMPCSGINKIDQKFPTAGPEETHWLLCWEVVPRNGLVIHWAFFRKAPTAKWIQIFWDARVSDIFVPYHNNSHRYYDMSGFNFSLVPIGPADCPATGGGTPLGGNVCKEVHDRGLAWKDWSQVRRGEEVVLWGALGAGNYNYVMEWTFRDDGMATGRVGATAVNLPSEPLETHMHNPIWRLDIDLDGFPGDTVKEGTHTEFLPTPPEATDTEPVVSRENGLDWDPHAFHQMNVYDATLKNGKGDPTSLQLVALPTGGLSRHEEDFTKHDFWVTLYKPTEMWAAQLPTYICPPEAVSNADIVLWYKGSVHHHPRDEDGEFVSGGWRGEALIMWTGWMLKPHNLFDRTPLYP
ncbi:MAG TPA: hypothetical protein VFN26_02555 [Candidatus Acidoferrum sp.]|nr:hypothetical protein [Candidatus Acidoferrum sp.]